MKITVERLVGWDKVVDSARTTLGKKSLKKEPSDDFKRKILVSEHSPIRNLLYEIVWDGIPYWVAMHFRTHHMGFKSSEDEIYFVETQRSDRTQKNRDELSQVAPVILRAQINAQAIINVSRVRLCKQASAETLKAWSDMLLELQKIEPILYALCVPNCIYKNGLCPEAFNGCGFNKSKASKNSRENYEKMFKWDNIQNN